jgi:predicted nucleic acid-binding protein
VVGILTDSMGVDARRARLERCERTPLPANDVGIAAAALDCGGALLTFDRDFERIPGLDLMLLAPSSDTTR